MKNSVVCRKILNFISLILIIFSFSIQGFAQQGDQSVIFKRNAVFAEFMGSSAFVYNITYDREIWVKENNRVCAAFGAQFFPKQGLLEDNLISFSPQISFLRGRVHSLEVGAGVTFNLFYGQWGLPLRIGYRYQPEDSGLFFRAALTPIITDCYPVPGSDFSFHFWGGFGIGYSFRDYSRNF